MNNILIKPKTQLEYIKDVEQEKHYKHVGQLTLKPGLKLYQFNLRTYELKEVDVKKTTVVNFDKKKLSHDKAMLDSSCVYFQCLNQKNAEKRAAKILTKAVEYVKSQK